MVDSRTRKDLHAFVARHVADDADAIFTDAWTAYEGIGDDDTRHESVNHSAKEWVQGEVHTNGVECLWSLLQRSLIGAYHKVNTKHLERYLDELVWRFNNRENEPIFRDTLARMVRREPRKYEILTA